MNSRTKTLVMAGALLAATFAASSQAADQSDYFAQQRQITDGFYPQYAVQPTPARAKSETARQTAENEWFERERAQGSGFVAPVPFPVPHPTAVASNAKPATQRQAAEDTFLTKERNETDGNVAPVTFTSGSSLSATVSP